MKIGIVGYGVVGKYLSQILSCGNHTVAIYDKYQSDYSSETQKAQVNSCDVAFLAVPTPQAENGRCNLTEVYDVLEWIIPPICIKSTVVPGTTERLVKQFQKRIVFSPEYIGETPYHLYRSRNPDVVTVGGDEETCELFLTIFRSVFGPEPKYFQTSSVTAELAKYMENCFLATKVAFVSEFYLLAKVFDANFTAMREIWCADPRVGRSHSTVTDRPGFRGKCLPKDLSALIAESDDRGYSATVLKAIQQANIEWLSEFT